MTDFFEIDEKTKTVKILNLEDFSVEDLENYLVELHKEVERTKRELKRKVDFKKNAQNLFK
tara:strand:+ start:258 stop:440 length:183 start_codon:yes stop_codon:yes gene_type:complete